MEVGDEDAVEVRQPDRAQQLALRSFAAVEQEAVPASPQKLSIEARDVGTDTIQQVDASAGVLLEQGHAALDAGVALGGERAVGLTAHAAFDLSRALKDREYLRGAIERPISSGHALSGKHLDLRAVRR